MELAFVVVAALNVATLVALLFVYSKYDRIKKEYGRSVEERLRLEGELIQAHVRERSLWQNFVDTLKEMRKEGFQTVPSDERWPTGGYSLTPEQEAQIERDRREGVGPNAGTFGVETTAPVDARPLPDHPHFGAPGSFVGTRPIPARPSLRIEE